MRHFLENIYFDKKLDMKDILDLYPKTIIDLRPNEFKFVIKSESEDTNEADMDGAEEEGTDGVAEKELLRIKYVYSEGKITKELYSDYFFNGKKKQVVAKRRC